MFVRLPPGLFRVRVVGHRDDRKPENVSGIAIDDLTIRDCDEYSRLLEVFFFNSSPVALCIKSHNIQ